MGCGSSRSTVAEGGRVPKQGLCSKKTNHTNGSSMNHKNKENEHVAREPLPAPVSFEIPVVAEESIIKKHPPKRLQKLEDQQIPVSQDHLLEKQQNAEERRQRMLQERVQSSRRSASRLTRRIPSKDLTIPEHIEHERSLGSPRKTKGAVDNVEF